MRHEWDFLSDESDDAQRRRIASDMAQALAAATAEEILTQAVSLHVGRLAVVSSFGAESVVLLHLVSKIDPSVPVIFIDTEMLFPETLEYQLSVAETFGLTDIRRISADDTVLRLSDPDNDLHQTAPDDCCRVRKTLPLETALLGFDGFVTGRKRHQTADRAVMDVVEVDHAGRYRFNPMARWSHEDLAAHLAEHDLPRHPLIAKGFASIGCAPCTTPVAEGEDPRAGRWRGTGKTECGIHFGPDGQIVRAAS